MRGLRFTIVLCVVGGLLAACDSAQLEQAAPDIGPAFTAAAGDPHPMNASAASHEDDVGASFAVISNGTVALGVRPNGDLNFGGVGVRFLPTGGEAIFVGCLCEGWGAADAISGTQGWASVTFGTFNVGNVSFASTASTATTVATVGGILRVTHTFAPSGATPFLYEIKVKIENISGAPVSLRYTRDMDWDVFPTFFSEFVTIQGTAAEPTVLYADDNGFQTPGPLFGRFPIAAVGDFIDVGPFDHGALFDFGFPGLVAPGANRRFTIFYGAAPTEAAALGALAAVGASVYSFGQPNVPGGPTLGVPNTFIFAYQPLRIVDIDIKPGSDPNSIKLGSKGLLPVAILTTPGFDAATVDPATVTLGDCVGTDTPVALRNNGTRHAVLQDVDGDGDLDLMLHFSQPALEANGDLTAASTSLTIKGKTFGNIPIEGSDAVRIIP